MADIIAVRNLVKRFGDVVTTVVLHGMTPVSSGER